MNAREKDYGSYGKFEELLYSLPTISPERSSLVGQLYRVPHGILYENELRTAPRLLRSNILRSAALCATLDSCNFFIFKVIFANIF
jgi:hypothetical protein